MTSSEVNNSKKIVYIDSFDDSNEDSSNESHSQKGAGEKTVVKKNGGSSESINKDDELKDNEIYFNENEVDDSDSELDDKEEIDEDYSDNDNDDKASMSSISTINTDDVLSVDPMYYRLTKFLQTGGGENVADILKNMSNQLSTLNLNITKILESKQIESKQNV